VKLKLNLSNKTANLCTCNEGLGSLSPKDLHVQIILSTNRNKTRSTLSTNESTPLQGIFPGTFLPSLGMVLVAWGGETHEKHHYQVLKGLSHEINFKNFDKN
jgi:hypothetical protein